MKITKLLLACLISLNATSVFAETSGRKTIFVNQDITTLVMMPENIKLVDISTDKVVGDQCGDNLLRIKPVPDSLMTSGDMKNGTFLAALTLIGERQMVQYDLIYSNSPKQSNSLIEVKYDQTLNYTNPEVPMTEGQMANYAWAISHSGRKFHTIRNKAYGMDAQVYNIYSMGGFFFIDLVLKNNTNIQYDIEQMRITLSDKKETKATNSQTIELTPSYILNKETSFKRNYRQVIVLPKLTYPEEKVLNIDITEDPISGRVISIPIQYEDILHADAFDGSKEDAYTKTRELNDQLNKSIRDQKDDYEKQIRRLVKELEDNQKQLDKANIKIDKLDGKIQKKSNQYIEIQHQLEALQLENQQLRDMIDPTLERADALQTELDNLRSSLCVLTGFIGGETKPDKNIESLKLLKAQYKSDNEKFIDSKNEIEDIVASFE